VLQERTGIGPRKLGRILNLIAEVGVEGDPVAKVMERAAARREVVKSRIEMMRAYAETQQCRWQFLLGYFGEELPEPCGDCDSCDAGTAQQFPTASASAKAYPVESRVRHETFGEGTVMDVAGDTVTVMFADVGYRTLHLPTVLEQELLHAF
jgi:ATP-dependent DNA helicase RecQ